MKNIIIVAALISFCSLSAHASYIQMYCSSPDGTVTQAMGVDSYFKLTERVLSDDESHYVKKVIDVATQDLGVTGLKEQTLEDTESTTCQEGDDVGLVAGRKLFYQRIRITNLDGSLFSENIIGVSGDRKYIEVDQLCEQEYNNMMACE